MKKIFYDEIDSTNLEIQRLAEKDFLEDFTVVIAEKQTQGKGQKGNSWISNLGGLYFSIIIRPKENIPLMSLLSGLSVLETLKTFSDKEIKIKWPNDIFINEKKISGVLTEGKFKGNSLDYIIVGCGININQDSFLNVEKNTPTSLKIETNINYDKNQVLEVFISKFKYNFLLSQEKKQIEIISKINTFLYKKNELITFKKNENEYIDAYLMGISEDGSIILKTKDNIEINFFSGQILNYKNI